MRSGVSRGVSTGPAVERVGETVRRPQEPRFGTRSAVIWLTAAVLLSITAMVADRRQWLAAPRDWGTRALAPVQQGLATTTRRIGSLVPDQGDISQVRSENLALRRQVDELRQEMVRLRGAALENRQLREQLQYVETRDELQLLSAEVIGRDSSSLLRNLIVNRGRAGGIAEGMSVVTPAGLAGRTVAVTERTATVFPINHPASAVNARIQGVDSATGIISGVPDGRLVLRYLPQDEPVAVGDLVVTSGLGGGFPPNIAIGRVTFIRSRDVEMFQEADVAPFVVLDRLDRVLIVTNFTQDDL